MNNKQYEFINACGDGNLDEVSRLIDKVDVNNRDEKGRLAITQGCIHHEVIDFLVKNKVNIDGQDKFGNTCLILTSSFGDDISVQKILLAGANVNITDTNGHTALHNATFGKHISTAKLLLENGADASIQDKHGGMAHIYVVDQEMLNLFHDINIDCKGGRGKTALIKAVENLNLASVELFVNNGASLDLGDQTGSTPLIHAVLYKCQPIVEYLVSHGACLESKDVHSKTALIYSVEKSQHEMVKYLCEHGAATDEALNIAVKKNYLISTVLLNKRLLNERDEDGSTLLMKACKIKETKVVLFLANQGADFFVEDKLGVSAYDILESHAILPDALQALKEKIMLDKLSTNSDDCETQYL